MPRRFDFVSPGVELTEVDQSILENESADDGAFIIGTTRTGPGMRPVRLRNKAHLFDVFGEPSPGVAGGNSDIWRNGNDVAPTYALYAAQAWLASETSPVTFVRLLGNDASTKGGTYTYAGWDLGGAKSSVTPANNVMAYGLFLIASGSGAQTTTTTNPGTLAAVLYVTGAGVALSGASAPVTNDISVSSSANYFVESCTDNAGFRIIISDGTATPIEEHVVDFDFNGQAFIRNVLNTNPQMIDSANNGSGNLKKYWLGETFERDVARKVTNVSSSAGTVYGAVIPLASGSDLYWVERLREAQPAKTGWFVNRSSLTGATNIVNYQVESEERLFRLVSLSDGEYFQNNYYVAIEDIKIGNSVNTNSTFTVCVKEYGGKEVEKYTNLNLDPNSQNYISRRIGDQNDTWNASSLKFTTTGQHPNISDFIRVEIASGVENGTLSDSYKVPFGMLGPLRPGGFTVASASVAGAIIVPYGQDGVIPNTADVGVGFITGGAVADPTWAQTSLGGTGFLTAPNAAYTGSFRWPDMQLTEQNSSANSTNFLYSHYFGINLDHVTKNNCHIDLLRELPSDSANSKSESVHVGENDVAPTNPHFEYSYTFSLDDIVKDGDRYYWKSGSFKAQESYSSINGTSGLLDLNVQQFVAPFFGGTDGVDITKTQPFANTILDGKSETSHYAYYSLDKALDIAAEPELVSYDVIAIPGLTNNTLNDKMINGCENRGDSLAIVDLSGIYKPKYENNGVESNGSVSSVLSTIKSRQQNSTAFNSSYGATYYPSLRLVGDSGVSLTVPPSVGALGALAKTDSVKAPWFAPAGFNQGGLAELGGRSGPKIIGVDEVLKKNERDSLYQFNINPIARLSNQIVIFGQKTLQQTPSALDRVNVRRLMIYIKKRIGDIANTILFDQNLQATWNRFKASADRVLASVQSEFGLEEYKIVLDSSTTTPDLVDRNILYAKIFIKPARSIEFIAVDFVITRSGIEL